MTKNRQLTSRKTAAALLAAVMTCVLWCMSCMAQEGVNRRVKTKISPSYPEVARRLGISGTVKLAVIIAPNGSVKNASVVGGHPVLVNAAMDAVKKWKFETAGEESTGTIEIKFSPQGN